MMQASDSVISWVSAVGGGVGVLTFLGGAVALGRFANRVDTIERDVGERASKESVTALKETLDSMRDDIAQIRDILLSGRRP